MKWLVVTSLFVLVSILASVSANKKIPKPILQVYYESLCGDSRRFIQRQLYPLVTSPIGEYFYVQLIPYGKAKTTKTGEDYTFHCQHGNDECRGNMLHACALRHFNESQSLEFVHCSMAASFPPDALDACTKKLSLPKDEIEKCMNSKQGKELLANHGERTHSLNPKLYFVPWITIDGIFDEAKFQASLSDLKTVMCKEINKDGKTPEGCDSDEEAIPITNGSESVLALQHIIALVTAINFILNLL